MSTFKGVVDEFPDIRIDYFRVIEGKRSPLAYFLSHVHSDHLLGLERQGGLFIYCSPATKELLIRLEKYHHRINFEQGLLETAKQQYKHLKSRLRTIPLNTPTDIELSPGQVLRVTLLDANHCAGAVMFLIEDSTKSILYTGDIRSEFWWVNSLIRNPVLIPYSHGHKRLDKLYLDTTFATKEDVYREFPTKSAGLAELLEKVSEYPKDTIFHFNAWTLGYEDVWIALSSALRSQIHVDQYKSRLYKPLAALAAGKNHSYEGPPLFGFPFGNQDQDGCLTSSHNVRLHSCELGTKCSTMENADVVFITPIISRSAAGQVLCETGAGGGGGDLVQSHDLELQDLDEGNFIKLVALCTEKIIDPETKLKALDVISKAIQSKRKAVSLDALGLDVDGEKIPLDELGEGLAKLAERDEDASLPRTPSESRGIRDANKGRASQKEGLPKKILFPYSRHSSYEELCHLVGAFNPRDIYPCTVDEDYREWSVSIEHLFGHLCSGTVFAHDKEMEALLESRKGTPKPHRQRDGDDSQILTSSRAASVVSQPTGGSRAEPLNLRSSPEPNPALSLSDELQRSAKRQCTSPRLARNDEIEVVASKARPAAAKLSPGWTIRHVKMSFEHYHNKTKKIITGQTRVAIDSKPGMRNGARKYGAPTSNAVELPRGTQAQPIELSDGNNSSTDDDNDEDEDDDEAGCFPLDQMPEPNSIPESGHSRSGTETQLTLSDAAFESQDSHNAAVETAYERVLHRKEAYEAARGLSGVWQVDHGLISSGAGHGEEELEL